MHNWRHNESYHPSKLTNYSPYLKVNQTKLNLKRQEGYMNDGTALNASDPNSMRDQGSTRNAQYVVEIVQGPAGNPDHWKSMYGGRQHAYNRFLPEHRDKRVLNKTFYSFGGSQSLERAQ